MTTTQSVGLNEQIQDHARRSKGWRHRDQAAYAYDIFAQINNNLFEGTLPAPLIGFDNSGRLKKAGDYSYDGDDLALKYHFQLRNDLDSIELVAALLHNAVHLRTEVYKGSATWYHSVEFKVEMSKFGLKVGSNGDVYEIDLAAFGGTLESIGQGQLTSGLLEDVAVTEAELTPDEVPDETAPVLVGSILGSKKKATKTKMRKWSCGCTNVRHATNMDAHGKWEASNMTLAELKDVTVLAATCNKCGQDFKLQD
jgi:hypothetical protein